VVQALIAARAELEVEDNWRRTALRVVRESGAAVAVEELLRQAGAKDSGGSNAEDFGPHELTDGQREQQQGVTHEFMVRMEQRGTDILVPEPEVKHMFKPTSGVSHGGADTVPAAKTATAGAPKKALSKFVEYPGDPQAVARHLEDTAVDPSGKDMFGLTALHKFAAWNKVDLLDLLLPHLSEDDLNAVGGDDGGTALHQAISMGAVQALARLLADPRVSKTKVDKAGHSPYALAASMAAAVPGFDDLLPSLQ